MVKSLRWRIQLWQGLILTLVVSGFGALVYARLHRARFDEVETELRGAAQSLVSVLRMSPPHELTGEPPPGPPGGHGPPHHFPGPPRDGHGPPHGPKRWPPPPGHRPPRPPFADEQDDGPRGAARFEKREGPPPDVRRGQSQHVQESLELPAALARHPLGPGEQPPYFIVWRADGELLKAAPSAPAAQRSMLENTTVLNAPRFRRDGEILTFTLAGPEGTRVIVGRSVRRELNELRQYRLLMMSSGAALLTLGMAGGFWLSHRALRPLRAMSATAAAISANNLAQRIDTRAIDSELAELATTLNAAFARLEDDFLRQARFTADASHELRTPLTILLGHLELAVKQTRAGGDCDEPIAACQRAAKRMRALVEGLLLLARADAGKLELDPRPFDLAETVEQCLDLLQPLAAAKRLALTADIAPAEILGDPRLIGQVVINLVTNAIEHTPPGGEVTVALHPRDDALELSVADTGEGIAAAHHPHLFERFYRVDAARARGSGGLGLGLAIARSLVTAHHGEIHFTSEVGHGTTFIVRLPHAESTAAPDLKGVTVPASATMRQAH